MAIYPSIIKNLLVTPLSLAELQPITQVSLPTLRKAVQELSDNHWIRIVGQSEANGGRPAMLFGLDDSYFMLIGVHIQLPGMRIIATDLTGCVLDEVELFQRVQPSPEDVLQAIIDYAGEIQSRFEDRKILGVGLATPGFTDPETGNIISIERVSGWQNFPICQRLENSLNVPVSIANDVDCMAFAEFQHTRMSFENNLAYIGYDEGIKVSLFLNGELYKGSFGNAGLTVGRFLNTSSDYLRVMSITGLNQIFEECVSALPESEQADYESIMQAHYRRRHEAIWAGAQDNLPVCITIKTMLNEVLTIAIANLVHIIQPDSVVIGGLLATVPDDVFTELSSSIRGELPALFANHVQIAQAQVTSQNSAALGAAYHFLEDFLTISTGIAPSKLLQPV